MGTSPHIHRQRSLVAQEELWLEGLDTKIEIRIYKENEKFYSYVSHDIQTPLQASPYAEGHPHDSIEEAIRYAVSAFTMFYGSAVADGHEPGENWLVENSHPWL